MHLTGVKKLEDCFEHSEVYEFAFADSWSHGAIQQLSALGELEYFADFPRPFFRLRTAAGMEVKGVEGEKNCRVMLPRRGAQEARVQLENHLDQQNHTA